MLQRSLLSHGFLHRLWENNASPYLIGWLALVPFLAGCGPNFNLPQSDIAQVRTTSSWSQYGGSGGRKFVSLEQVDKANVDALEIAWVYRTGELSDVFQMTPILVDGQLVGCSPFNTVFALDPLTGGEIWSFDPQIDRAQRPANNFNCRGVSTWTSPEAGVCSSRILTATNDSRLIALDSKTGLRCKDFGSGGVVDLSIGVGALSYPGEYQVTSPPAITGDVVVVGSAISDNQRIDAPSGVVRGYNARTGDLVWAFDLAPPGFDAATRPVSSHGYALGTPNVWSAISADAERDLVFLPTGNPAPDYFRTGLQADLDHYGSSVVALRASTGEVVWHFNTVLHDFWDFDVPSQPVLADLTLDGERVPVVIQSTKMGFIFVLHRETGKPVVDVTYRDVPRHGPLQDVLSPVQPFPPAAFQVSRSYKSGSALFGLCDEQDAASVSGPIYTPITQHWTIGLPSNMGATNWGGVAVDEERGLIAVRTSSVPFRTKLISRKEAGALFQKMRDPKASSQERAEARARFYAQFDLPQDTEVAPQNGTDYLMARHAYLDQTIGLPCAGAPFGEVMVIDVASQTQVWRRSHGSIRDLAPVPLPIALGIPGVGGHLVTKTGLMITAGIVENAIRAYDMDTGEVLWHHRLPHPGNATPMSYSVYDGQKEKQFVVIAAGGDTRAGSTETGDYLIAFSLPGDGDKK